jgi:PKD repeat protein
LSVSNAYGSDSKLRTNYIQVNAPPPPPPVADFVASPLVGFNPLGVGFTDQSINAPTSWEWDFTNDGIVDSTAQNPMHIYPTPGTYTVKLTVSNDYGSDSKTRVNYIEVNVAPPDIIVTTWPYPIYSFDSLDTEFGINTTAGGGGIYLRQDPIEGVDVSFGLLSGTVQNVLSSITLPPEDFIDISSMSITSGTLVNTLVSFSQPPEDFIDITNLTVTGGTLVNALVTNTIPDEGIDTQFTLLSGSLV